MSPSPSEPPRAPATLEEAAQLIAALFGQVQELLQQNGALRERVQELEERLKTNSNNSSKPPSTDSIWSKPKPGKPGSKERRKRGGQPGHPGKRRELLPPDKVDQTITCVPQPTCECGGDVHPRTDGVERLQFFEVPPLKPHVTEVRLVWGACGCCGRRYRGERPEGTPEGMLGPRAMAIAAWLVGDCKVPRRVVQAIFADCFGIDISLGAVSNSEHRVSDAVAQPVAEAFDRVREQSVVYMDETGYREAGKRRWLWVAVTSLVTVFLVRTKRAAAVAQEFLGASFAGRLVTDRWSGYTWFSSEMRQLCWAHLIRDFTKLSERVGASAAIGTELLKLAKEMFRLWHRFKDGDIDRRQLQADMQPVREAILAQLQLGTTCGHKKTARTCANILALKVALWTFIDHDGVEPTNNTSERALRPSVIWRKRSFGSQGDRGSRFVERMLTVAATCRRHGRNVIDYLTDVIDADRRGHPVPGLVPTQAPPALAKCA